MRRFPLLAAALAGAISLAALRSPAQTAPAQPAPPAAATVHPHAAPRLNVLRYEVHGNTILKPGELDDALLPHTGTNLTVQDVVRAVSDLQLTYRDHGYPTITVTLPPQQITNGVVQVHVYEGKLAEIVVEHNHYFSEANIRRALPSLETNILMNRFVFQAELDRANANRDRQIYPEIRPGPETNTSSLFLETKDRLPLHGRVEVNNQNTPNTPELRINTSLVYNNLWQHEHSLGLQYSLSPEAVKDGDQWNFYDRPLIANYSVFYRLPLGSPEPVGEQVELHPGTFGYSEATRQFVLPPPSGSPELNVYASRATIDTSVIAGPIIQLPIVDTNSPGGGTNATRTAAQQDLHQDLTINETLGFRFSKPLPEFGGIRSVVSAGADFKSYRISSFATNDFIFTELLTDVNGNPLPPRISVTPSRVPPSSRALSYVPISLRWDGDRKDKSGDTTLGLSYSANSWFSGSDSNLQAIANSTEATGYWHSFGGNLGRDQVLHGDWRLNVRLDGQWATEPLISNEQFGVGGVAGVRGYHEGEAFGDAGWRLVVEPRTPSFLAMELFDRIPCYIRFSAFVDYGETYLLDPGAREGRTPLCGVGGGMFMSIGSHWEGKLALGLPLLATAYTEADKPRAYFALSAQF